MHIALVESANSHVVMKGRIHEFHDRYYLVVDGNITRWYPVVYENWTWAFHKWVGWDVYKNDLFLRDIVGFFTEDGIRKAGIIFEDEVWGVSIREITSIENDDLKWGGEDYFCTPECIRRLGTTLQPNFQEIRDFLSGTSIETDRMMPIEKIAFEQG